MLNKYDHNMKIRSENAISIYFRSAILFVFFASSFVWIPTKERFGLFHLIIFKYNSISFSMGTKHINDIWEKANHSILTDEGCGFLFLILCICPWTLSTIIKNKKRFCLHLISNFIRFHCSTQIVFCCYVFLSVIETSI